MKRLHWLLAAFFAIAVIPSDGVAQERGTITGQVLDQSSGQPLQGVQVSLRETNVSVATNAQGRFAIPAVTAGTHHVVFRQIGYRELTQEVVVVGGSSAVVNVRLEQDILRLDELVVVGYGTERRRNVAGAIASIRPEGVEELPTPSIDNVLQGRISGVQVTQNSGTPGAAMTVRVRGSSSISAGNQPLYVLDGVPMTQGDYSGLSGFGGQGIDALSDLNPSEIESIEVLKDASAAAIYGARASNGVVLITTKRGRTGDAEINISGYYGIQKDWKRVEFLNTDQYFEVYNETRLNEFGEENYFGYTDDGVANVVEVEPGTYTNWIDEVLRTAPVQNLSASIRGGTDRVRYFVSGTAFDQQGIVKAFGYNRLSGRVNLDYQPTERLTFGTNVALTRGITDRARGDNTVFGPFANANAIPPYQTVYNEDGTYTNTRYANPVGLNNENEARERSLRVLANTFATFEVTPWLSVRGSVGLDQFNLNSRMYDSPIVGVAVGSGGEGTASSRDVTKMTYEGTANFNRDFSMLHSVSGVIGTSYEHNTNQRHAVWGTQFPTEHFRYLTSAATITGGTSSLAEWSLMSFFGRLTYNYGDRYTAAFNIRADGSSRFGSNNRYGIFPSASFLWRLSEESFMQNQNVFSDLGLRLSYGRTGNQEGLGNFASRGLWSGGYNYDDAPGTGPSQLANPELRWEKTDQFNVGVDFSVLNDRLAFNVDYYIKKTTDLLINRPVPSTTGYTTIYDNVGAMENRGVELSTRAQILTGANGGLSWTAEFNIATNKNEVTELYNGDPIRSGFASWAREGQPVGVFWGYVTDGLFRSQEEVEAHAFQNAGTAPGDIRFKDLDDNGVINAADQAVIGNPWPDFTGGLTNTLSYRGFDLTAFLQFSYGNDIFNANRIYWDAYGSYWDNNTTRALDRWTPDNPDATEPRATWYDLNGNTRISDRFIEDGSYLRLKNVVLGYTVPRATANRFGFRSLRVYVQGQNLLTFTNYSGYDPEVNYAGNTSIVRGTDFYTLPQARALTAGFNIGL